MPFTIYPYENLTASEVASKASSGIATYTVNGSQVDTTNISLNGIKTVIGDSTASLSGVCQSANVNIYSNFSPRVWSMANPVSSAPKTPYKMSYFAGYKHNALTPNFNTASTINLGSSYAGTTYNLSLDLNLGDVDWAEQLGYDYCIMKRDGTTVSSSAFALSTYTANQPKTVTVPVTCPAEGGTTSYEIQAWFGSDVTATGRLTPATGSRTVHIALAPYFGNLFIVDSQANRDVLDAFGTPYVDYPTEYCAVLDTVVTDKTLSSTTLQCKYTCTCHTHLTSNNSNVRTINFRDRDFHCDVYMYKYDIDDVLSSDYLVESDAWIEYTDGGESASYTIPVGLGTPADGDRFYVKFDNLW